SAELLQRETNRYVDSTKSWKRFVITYVLAVIRSLKASLSVGKRRPGWFFGLNDQGEIMSFTLTSGNTDDRAVVEKLTQYLTGLLFGDRWYISKH
ncbi:MAG: transposase, partial [Candidatus Midichloria mitochondrii]|nr:transposase [Candidatus Midichloria mitochondrii]